MRSVLRTIVLGGLGISLLAGCDTNVGKLPGEPQAGRPAGDSQVSRPAGQPVDDKMITSQVKARLADEKTMTVAKVDVDTKEGVVHLSGSVQNAAMKERATELAREVNGVRAVVNNLTVEAS